MRVRKSIPEGYKTGSEYSAFNLFSESKSLPSTPTMENSARSTKTRPRANAGPRELMPFCGLLKVGGMSSQQSWGIYSPTHETRSWSRYDCHSVNNVVLDEDDVPVLSQGSTVGNSSRVTTPNGNKRRCEWDDSGDDDSTKEFSFSAPVVLGERPIAVPRRKKYQVKAGSGQKNRPLGAEMDFDFGEADFLDFSGLGKGREVEMGGV